MATVSLIWTLAFSTLFCFADASMDVVLGLIKRTKINNSQFQSFCKKLQGLISDFEKANSSDGETYALNVSLYPHKIDNGPIGRIKYKKKSQ